MNKQLKICFIDEDAALLNVLNIKLSKLESLILSSIGADKRLLKVFTVNSEVNLTNSSHKLIDLIFKKLLKSDEEPYEKWFYRIIEAKLKASCANYYDCNLFCLYLICRFTRVIILQQSEKVQTTNGILSEWIFKALQRDLLAKVEQLCIKVNLDDTQFLRNFLTTHLSSKASFRLSLQGNDSAKFVNLLLKAFLKSLNSENSGKLFAPIIYKIDANGSNITESKLYDGLLLELDVSNSNYIASIDEILKAKKKKSLKVVLFDCSLSGEFDLIDTNRISFETREAVNKSVFILLDRLKEVCEILVKKRVDVVLCQKVIHPSIKLYLFKNGLIAIDRLSINHINEFIELTGNLKKTKFLKIKKKILLIIFKGCEACCNPCEFNIYNLESIYGNLTNLSLVYINDTKKSCLKFENNLSNIQTMVISLPNDLFSDEIKVY